MEIVIVSIAAGLVVTLAILLSVRSVFTDPVQTDGLWEHAPSRRFLSWEVRWVNADGTLDHGDSYYGDEEAAKRTAEAMNQFGVPRTSWTTPGGSELRQKALGMKYP